MKCLFSRVNCVPHTFPPSRDHGTGWHHRRRENGTASHYWISARRKRVQEQQGASLQKYSCTHDIGGLPRVELWGATSARSHHNSRCLCQGQRSLTHYRTKLHPHKVTSAETLTLTGNDNDNAGGTLNQPVLGFLVG